MFIYYLCLLNSLSYLLGLVLYSVNLFCLWIFIDIFSFFAFDLFILLIFIFIVYHFYLFLFFCLILFIFFILFIWFYLLICLLIFLFIFIFICLFYFNLFYFLCLFILTILFFVFYVCVMMETHEWTKYQPMKIHGMPWIQFCIVFRILLF